SPGTSEPKSTRWKYVSNDLHYRRVSQHLRAACHYSQVPPEDRIQENEYFWSATIHQGANSPIRRQCNCHSSNPLQFEQIGLNSCGDESNVMVTSFHLLERYFRELWNVHEHP